MPRKPSYLRSKTHSGSSNGSVLRIGAMGWTRGSISLGRNLMVEQPAQLDSSRELAALVKDGANGGGLFLADDEHPKSCEREPCPASGDCITVCRVLVQSGVPDALPVDRISG